MRVALVCPYSLSRPGGVQGQVLGLARALGLAGHDAVVFAPTDELSSDRDLAGVSLIGLGRSVPVRSNGSVAPVSLDPIAAGRGVMAIRRSRFDVVNIHEPLAPGAGYGCLVACDAPIVGTFHRAGVGLAYRAFGPLARLLTGRLDVRCAVSPEAESTAFRVLRGRYEIVGNGIEVGRFTSAQPWATETPTVLFVGRHEPRKGLEVLLEAWGRLSPHEAKLWVAGEGPQSRELRARHSRTKNVEWLGRIPDEELASRLAGADIFCAPSLGGESFGVVLVEAMAACTSVIASDLPGYSFAARGHAVLFSPGNAGELAEKLAIGLADAAAKTGSCAPEVLEAARSHAQSWSMEALAGRYVALFAPLLH